MSKYVRSDKNIVVEVIEMEPDQEVADCFHPDIVQSLIDTMGRKVEIGWLIVETEFGWAFAAPSDDVEPDVLAVQERLWRDGELGRNQWLTERHRDELDLGVETALNAEYFSELLAYRQALRDWPAAEVFPDSHSRPNAPDWLEDAITSY